MDMQHAERSGDRTASTGAGPTAPVPGPLTVPHPGMLPEGATCGAGWCFEVYHPHVDYPGIQMIEADIACLEPSLDAATDTVLDIVGFLIRSHRMAGRVDGDVPGVGWTPYGSVTTHDGGRVRIERLDRVLERPLTTTPETAVETADTAVLQFPPPRLAGVRCEDGWMMSYSQPVIDAATQIVSLRAACEEPDLDRATQQFGEWIGGLMHARLLSAPRSTATISTTVDPLGAAIAPDGKTVQFA